MAFLKSIETPGVEGGLMVKYIKYLADKLMVDLGYSKVYNESTSNPCEWMERVQTKVVYLYS